jgi:cation-transporting ATPase E
MIPEGLYLLVSIALTVSVIRLASRRTLVQEMGCVELLARVDGMCVDKTGTITEPRMEVKGMIPLCEERFNAKDIETLMADYAGNMPAENETMSALRAYFGDAPTRRATTTMPFSSTLKYGGMSFFDDESYLLGAPERILQSEYHKYREEIEKHSAQGYRVLLLALYDGEIGEKTDARAVMPLALMLLSNRIREGAPATFKFFAQQGVKIIVISGDNPLTVSQIAREAGIEGAERYIDAAELSTDKKLKRAVGEYVVFGRVTPDQKRKLVRALKAVGHTVAMTGDGVNDVLALKDANCSIAMASGSEVASQVADIVLLDSDFAAMPSVVMEGRRVINNIERTAALYLMKNIFSFLFAIVVILIALPYPLSASQITLYSMMMIGIPSFVMALEPNKKIVKGRFILNVLRSAMPAGLTDFFALIALVIVCTEMAIPVEEMGTMACIIVSFVGLLMLYKLSIPLNQLRIVLIAAMAVGFVVGATLMGRLFDISALSWLGIWVTAAFCAAAVPVMLALSMAFGTLRLSDILWKQSR